jgi:imidazolonepropionase-like amidohydrolase
VARLAITGATVLDGTGAAPVEDAVVLIADGRIEAVGPARHVPVPAGVEMLDARGRFAIPGLIDAVNSAWFNTNVENLVRYEGRYHELFVEAAQIALKAGVTGMFATWRSHEGARRARELIRSGETVGARIYLGGNIIGFDGLFSPDAFPGAAAYVSRSFVRRLNEEWEKGTGRRLMWLTPDEVRPIVRAYFEAERLDYAKYAASGHFTQGGHLNAQFIAFSPRVQAVLVEEAHRAGLTMQAHTTSVETTDLAIEAGVDILTHGDLSGPDTPYPQETIEKLVARGVGVGVLPVTVRNLEARRRNTPGHFTDFLGVARTNRIAMIRAGVQLQVGTECSAMSADDEALFATAEDNSIEPSLHWKLGEGHFNALAALEEEGLAPQELLKTATSNAARAYRLADVGTLEPGKLADVVLLDADPLESAANYRRISAVLLGGRVVDRDALPERPLITA